MIPRINQTLLKLMVTSARVVKMLVANDIITLYEQLVKKKIQNLHFHDSVHPHFQEGRKMRDPRNMSKQKQSYLSLSHLHSPQVNVPFPEQCELDSSYKKYIT